MSHGYDAAAWADGPGPVYDRLADAVVSLAPDVEPGAIVVDVGAGTGAASRAVVRRGGSPVAVDLSEDMLAFCRSERPPAAVADAARLPLVDGRAAGVVAAFSLTHLDRPEDGLAEAARVTRAGGWLVASSFGPDRHPAKEVVDAVLSEGGWEPPPWYVRFKRELEGRFTDVESFAALAAAAGLRDGAVHLVGVDSGLRTAEAIVRYRFGMAQFADHLAAAGPDGTARLFAQAVGALGPSTETMVLDVAVLVARVP